MGASFESYLEVMNLIHAYPDCIDRGDYAGIGALLGDAEIEMGDGTVMTGAADVRGLLPPLDPPVPRRRHAAHAPLRDEPDRRTSTTTPGRPSSATT